LAEATTKKVETHKIWRVIVKFSLGTRIALLLQGTLDISGVIITLLSEMLIQVYIKTDELHHMAGCWIVGW